MSDFNYYPKEPKSKHLINSFHLLTNTHRVCNDFSSLYDLIMIKKITEGVVIADNNLDLFRAALLFSSSGLDSLAKQLVRDSLSEVIMNSEGAEIRLKTYVEKKISKNDISSSKFLSTALVSTNPRDHFLDCLIYELTDRSLQSKDELLNVASYFDIPSSVIVSDFTYLRDIFNIRNQIAHEMDFDYKTNTRRERDREVLFNATNYIFEVSMKFLDEVDKKLE